MTVNRSPIFRNSDESLRRLEREAGSDPFAAGRLELALERSGMGFTAWVESRLAMEAGRGRAGMPTSDNVRTVVRALLACPHAFSAELNYGVKGNVMQIQTLSTSLCDEWIQTLWSAPKTSRPSKKKRVFVAAVLDGDFVTVGVKSVFAHEASLRQAWEEEIGAPSRAARHFNSRALRPYAIEWSRRAAPDRRRTTTEVARLFASSVLLPSFYRVWAGQHGTPCEHVERIVPAER